MKMSLFKIPRFVYFASTVLITLILASCGGSSQTGAAKVGMNTQLVGALSPWARQAGGIDGGTYGNGIDVDNAGNSYVTGETDVGISGQLQTGFVDFFVAKYDALGKLLWTSQVGAGDEGETYGRGISVDSAGNSYVTGETNRGLSGQAQNGYNDYFVAKYDTLGVLQWIKQAGAANGTTYARGISVDGDGNSYIAGFTDVGISGEKQNGSTDYFIAKYDSQGVLQWTKQFGTHGLYTSTEAHGIRVDNTGSIYVTGGTNVALADQHQNGVNDYFIAKHNMDGTLQWLRQVGTPDEFSSRVTGEGVGVDNAGNSYVIGSTFIDISGQKKQGDLDYFIAKYNELGVLQWTKLGGARGGWTAGAGISVDGAGRSYVTGNTNVDISGEARETGWHYFVASFDESGALQGINQTEVLDGNVFARGIHVDSAGHSYVTGSTDGRVSGQPQNGVTDYFVAFDQVGRH